MKNRKVFTGLLFILAGISLVLNKLGYFNDINILSFIASIYLLSFILKSIMKRNFFGILVPSSLIAVIYADYIGIKSFNPWILVPSAALISIGLDLIFVPKKKCFIKKDYAYNSQEEDILDEDKGYLYLMTSFSENIKYLKSENLKTLDLECNFGSMKIYLDNVTLKDDVLYIKVDASFSGIELYIPKDWEVINNSNVVFGGVKEKNRTNIDGNKKVILTGDVNFAGIDIIYI